MGGTWRDNTYPGCHSDVPAMLYSYSFAPNPDWTRTHPPQQEIWDYLKRCADRYGVTEHIRFGAEVVRAEFDEGARLWQLSCADGREVQARVLISAPGMLQVPAIPDFPGLESFRGPTFHPARWNHDVDLRGKRVAIIGNGSSAVQFIPHVVKVAEQVTAFQRSAAWVLPGVNRRLTRIERAVHRLVPPLLRARRTFTYWLFESRVLGMAMFPSLSKAVAVLLRANIRRSVRDPDLARRLSPDYMLGCKRTVMGSGYYEALTQPNVNVITEHIREVSERGLITADGIEHQADVIIFGTGFQPAAGWLNQAIIGVGGRSLTQAWESGVQAYLGVSVAGFPNLFLLAGPNTSLGHNSVIFMFEAQIRYVLRCLKVLSSHANSVLDVRLSAQQAFNKRLDRQFSNTVWSSGCTSHYLDATGRNYSIWPGFTFGYWLRTRKPRLADYELVP